MKLTLETKQIGENGFFQLRTQIDNFISENWDLLYEGSVRLNCNIEEDYYAPQRIQINETRLHAGIGLKYADGHKYDDDQSPTEEQLKNTIRDIQLLINEASKKIPAPFVLKIIE